MNILKTTLALLILFLLAMPAETFAQSAGGQISRRAKTAARKNVAKTSPNRSTAKKPAARKAVRSSKPIPNGAVDLGLPSGTLWADRNIGANSPEGYGDYFAWGETRPKLFYDWSTYKYCDGSYNVMTKYCTDSSKGKVDNKTVLDPSDDAATANWCAAWRMPTHEEQVELNEKCTWTKSTLNGVKGYKVTGPNGNSIFLPAAGVRMDSDVTLVYLGTYASASLVDYVNLHCAWRLEVNLMDDTHTCNDGSRCYGWNVRAVVR